MNKIVQEKNEAIFEKEQHRTNVHKLVRALKRERQKFAALEEKYRGQLRLEYASRGQVLAVGGNREELYRIKNELSVLDAAGNKTQSTHPQESSVPTRAAPACMMSKYATTTLSPQKPRTSSIPSPLTPPRHPASKTTSRTHATANDENAYRQTNNQMRPPGETVTKQWNGNKIDTRRRVSSDSKVDRLKRERDSRAHLSETDAADVEKLLR